MHRCSCSADGRGGICGGCRKGGGCRLSPVDCFLTGEGPLFSGDESIESVSSSSSSKISFDGFWVAMAANIVSKFSIVALHIEKMSYYSRNLPLLFVCLSVEISYILIEPHYYILRQLR